MKNIIIILLTNIIIINAIIIPKEFTIRFNSVDRQNNQIAIGILNKVSNKIESFLSIGKEEYLYDSGRMLFKSESMKTPKCIDKSDVPPYEQMLNSLYNAIPLNKSLTSYDKEVNNCKDKRWKIEYSGESYILCQENMKFTRLIGKNVIINIEQFSNFVNMKLPVMKEISKCKKNTKEYSKNVNNWFEDEETCNLKIKDEKECIKIKRKEKKKHTCIFLHGVGQSESGNVTDTFVEYWGNIHENTPQCDKRYFIKEESLSRGWDNIELQKSFCKVALMDQNKNEKIIKNKILFVHSMGNLIISAAIKNKFCEIDKTTSWYDIQGPILGSDAAKYIVDVCEGRQEGWGVKYIAEIGGYCDPKTNTSYPAYKELSPEYPGIKELYAIAKSNVKGVLCGTSSYGLQTRYGIALSAISYIVGFDEPNDGMVPFSSCNLGFEFEEDFQSNFYKSNINHADGTMRNNNGWWGNDRQPISWIQTRKGY
jgi:hypothetical protein